MFGGQDNAIPGASLDKAVTCVYTTRVIACEYKIFCHRSHINNKRFKMKQSEHNLTWYPTRMT